MAELSSFYSMFHQWFNFSGLHFHVVGEGVVRIRTLRQERVYDRENYIDFHMRLLGEAGIKTFKYYESM